MAKIQSQIENKLKKQFQPLYLDVINESYKHHVPEGSESHFLVVLVSQQFEGQTRIQRQRSVYSCLSDELGGEVHALSQKLYTSEEWDNIEDKNFSTPNCAGGSKV